MKPKNPVKYQSICIPQKSINATSIFPSFIGKKLEGVAEVFEEIEKIYGEDKKAIQHDCRLGYDKLKKRYVLSVPVDYTKKKCENRQQYVAIDPGCNKFLSFYSDDNYGYIGGNTKLIDVEINKIRKIDKNLEDGINRKGEPLRNEKKLKMEKKKIHDKITNRVKELHNQSALYLCKNYDNIILPILNVSKLSNVKQKIKNIKETIEDANLQKAELKKLSKARKIERNMMRIMYRLGHYKFRQHFQNKCFEYGCNLLTTTEEYTSQTCTFCGFLSKTYDNRVKKCSNCMNEIDRDINGARNIFMKYIKENGLLRQT